MPDALDADRLPAPLLLPVTITVRNAERNVNTTGQAGRLDETGLVATFPVEIEEGTVLFTTIEMPSINAAARALIRVASARSVGENVGYEVVAQFADLNADARDKIDRLRSGRGEDPAFLRRPNFVQHQKLEMPTRFPGTPPAAFMPPTPTPVLQPHMPPGPYPNVPMAPPSYFEPAPYRPVTKTPLQTKIWNSIGVTGYIVAFLIIVALFPKGRAVELYVWQHIAYAFSRLWYWATHINKVQLYNNCNGRPCGF